MNTVVPRSQRERAFSGGSAMEVWKRVETKGSWWADVLLGGQREHKLRSAMSACCCFRYVDGDTRSIPNANRVDAPPPRVQGSLPVQRLEMDALRALQRGITSSN